ncbi:hypothetical protein [Sanguibacter suarezii]|uniref:hypothetical protein n=1 Tax=Sanguibacter suarezii TaxID=60921 RepID=UPI0012F722CC|nr:hypothetical protein [Sanguibacter suarezii]
MANAAYDYLWLAMVLAVVALLCLAFRMWKGRARDTQRPSSLSPRPSDEGPADPSV